MVWECGTDDTKKTRQDPTHVIHKKEWVQLELHTCDGLINGATNCRLAVSFCRHLPLCSVRALPSGNTSEAIKASIAMHSPRVVRASMTTAPRSICATSRERNNGMTPVRQACRRGMYIWMVSKHPLRKSYPWLVLTSTPSMKQNNSRHSN
jgi:hypothetical protein